MKVVDSIKLVSASYKLVTTSEFPSSFDKSLDFPNTLKNTLDIQEGYYLHIAVKAGFSKSTERPKQAYLSLRIKGSEKNLYQNVYGSFNVEKERFQFTLDVQNDLKHFNGEYEL